MSSQEENENKFLTSRKESNASETTVKTTFSFSNPQLNKKNIISNLQNFPLNTHNFNFNKSNLIKSLNFNKEVNKNYLSSSSLSTLSTPLTINKHQNIINISPSKDNCSDSNENKINLLNNYQYNQLVNNLNFIFSKIQNLHSQNFPCPKECNVWIEYFKNIYNDIIGKNKENEYYELIKNTLMLMFFSIVIIYDINNKNKQRLFADDIKNIMNIHNLMSESIYGNSFNSPNINPKEESQVLMLSCKDMNNRLTKILNQYDRINSNNDICNFYPIFRKLKSESFENVYDYYIKNVRNPNHINLNYNIDDINNENKKVENPINPINKFSMENQYKTNTFNLNPNYMMKTNSKNQILQNNNVANLNGVSAFFDSSNNVFLFRKQHLKSTTPNKQNQKYQINQNNNTQIYNNNAQQYYKNFMTYTPTQKSLNNNFIIQNEPNMNFQEKCDENLLFYNNKELIESGKLYIASQNSPFYRKTQSSNIINPPNLNYPNQNIINNNNYKAHAKTPIKVRKVSNQNIGQLNLNILKNQSLTPIKVSLSNNSILIPFPPSKPYTLVLDLDETLVNVPKGTSNIILRPGLRDFLHSLLPYYELIVFTTGVKEYADQILNFIEIDEKYFSFRLYRQNATCVNENYYKDLNKLGRDIKKIIIVDDKKVSMELQEANGIIIKPFIFNPDKPNEDFILFDLIRVLIRIAKEKPDDVRESLKNYRYEIYNKISND